MSDIAVFIVAITGCNCGKKSKTKLYRVPAPDAHMAGMAVTDHKRDMEDYWAHVTVSVYDTGTLTKHDETKPKQLEEVVKP